jgi:hypothetical protein
MVPRLIDRSEFVISKFLKSAASTLRMLRTRISHVGLKLSGMALRGCDRSEAKVEYYWTCVYEYAPISV